VRRGQAERGRGDLGDGGLVGVHPTQVELGRPSPIEIEPFWRMVSSYMMTPLMNAAAPGVVKSLSR